MAAQGELTVERRPDATVEVRLAGRWRMGRGLAAPPELAPTLDGPPVAPRLTFDAHALTAWDTSLLVVVERVVAQCRRRGVPVDTSTLPDGLRRLLTLSEVTPAHRPPPASPPPSRMARIGERAIDEAKALLQVLTFMGELAFSLARLLTHRARVRHVDLLAELEDAGARSLSIVALVSFLLGVIIAFVATTSLERFGAGAYVADTVAIGMVREMGPLMTAVVMSGRSGSAYAARLGTMKVTQEVDALTTMALPASDFLVLPRVLALALMLPLLAVFADFIGIASGGLMVMLSGGNVVRYFHQVPTAVKLSVFWISFLKSAVFGVVVATSGCMHGLRASKGAAAVGDAATATVVSSIVWIIVIDGIFAVFLHVLNL